MSDSNALEQCATIAKVPNSLEMEMMLCSLIYQGKLKEMMEREKRYSNGKLRVLNATFVDESENTQSEDCDSENAKEVMIVLHSKAKKRIVFSGTAAA